MTLKNMLDVITKTYCMSVDGHMAVKGLGNQFIYKQINIY